MSTRKRIIVSVSNDLSTDQRVQKICASLSNQGYNVLLLGRWRKDSQDFSPEHYQGKRFSLWFNKGPLFYINLNIRLFVHLLFSKSNLLLANDLDVLAANYLASKLKSLPLVYDSHEYFTEVPELVHRPRVKSIWEFIEKRILPKLKHSYTVSPGIADAYYEKYGLKMDLIFNFPRKIDVPENLNKDRNTVIYQGALNVGRGLEELIAAFQHLPNKKLLIAGAGDIENDLKKQVKELGLEKTIIFLGRLSPNELRPYTLGAGLGISIEKDIGLNYRFAVPNKVFDCIQCLTPILYSDLIEVKKIIGAFDLGEELRSYDAKEMAEQIKSMLESNQYEHWQQDARKAREVLNWEHEEKKLKEIFNNI